MSAPSVATWSTWASWGFRCCRCGSLRRLSVGARVPHAAPDAHRRRGPGRVVGPGRRTSSRRVTTSVAAAESAAAKVARVLPRALQRRLDALLQSTDFTVRSRPGSRAGHDSPVAVRRGCAGPQAGRDELHLRGRTAQPAHGAPYGIVAHSGRWYVTGADSASHQNRTFRLDRVLTAELRARAGSAYGCRHSGWTGYPPCRPDWASPSPSSTPKPSAGWFDHWQTHSLALPLRLCLRMSQLLDARSSIAKPCEGDGGAHACPVGDFRCHAGRGTTRQMWRRPGAGQDSLAKPRG